MYPVLKNYIEFKLQPSITNLYYVFDNRIISSTDINETGKEVLFLCNGVNSIEDIKIQLSKKYNEEYKQVSEFIEEFIEKCKVGNIISIEKEKKLNPIELKIKGSKQYWTPKHIAIELTHNCPLRCKHCFLNAGIGSNIDYDLLKKLCDEIVDLGIEKVQLTGGEPFLYDKLEEIVDFLCENNISIDIYTSGFVNTDKAYNIISKIKKVNGLVQVSIDGLRESHDKIRAVDGSFNQAINFIKKSVELGVTTTVATCITDQEYNDIDKLAKYLKSIGINRYRLGNVIEQGRARENISNDTCQSNLDIHVWRRKLANTYNSENFIVESLKEDDVNLYLSNDISCGMGYTMLKISPEGYIYPCVLSEDPAGNLQDISIKEYLKIKSFIFTELKKPTKTYCKDCENEDICGGCIIQAINKSQKSDSCKWYLANKYILEKVCE